MLLSNWLERRGVERMIHLKIDDLFEIEGRIYRVVIGKWKNMADWKDKHGAGQGFHPQFKLVREKELAVLLLRRENEDRASMQEVAQ